MSIRHTLSSTELQTRKGRAVLTKLCKSGMTRRAIGRELGVSGYALANALRHFGLSTNGHVGSQEKTKIAFVADDVYDRYFTKKETATTIARVYGCSNVSVLKFIRSQGWVVRDNKSSQATNRLDTYSPENVERYKQFYLAGNGGIWKTAEHFGLNGRKLIAVARRDGWYIDGYEYQQLYYEPQCGVDSAPHKAMLRRLKASTVTRPGYLGHYRELVTSLTRKVVNVYHMQIPGAGNSVDHVYPVSRAFYGMDIKRNPCKLLELCHPANLRFLDQIDNNN